MARRNIIEVVIVGKDEASKIAKGVSSAFKGLGTAALAGGAVVAGAFAGAGLAIGKLALDAAPLAAVEAAFAGLAESADVGADEMLSALERGSAGMIAQSDLMMQFNQAAGLVSLDFAQKLPDAMGVLGKVAAATGQDMDYMLGSLIKGVGRLSPMILDNLNIQVSLEEATAKAAAMFGVQAEALEKDQIQAGMFEVVMAKLAVTTAEMPEVAGSAAAEIARMRAQFKNTTETLGKALQPALQKVLGVFSLLAEKVVPPLVGLFETYVVPIVERAALWFEILFSQLANGIDPLTVLMGLFTTIAMDLGMASGEANALGRQIRELIVQVGEFIQPIVDWIAANVEIKDVLLALGVAIATVVVPIIISLLSSILPIIAVFVALTLASAAIRAAWESDWMGIRTTLTAVWEETIKPALAQLYEWLKVNIPIAIAALKKWWTETLMPAMRIVAAWVVDTLIPTLIEIYTVIMTTLMEAITFLADLWINTLKPALDKVWAFIVEHVIPILEALSELIGVTITLVIEAFAALWRTVLKPALEVVWAFVQDHVIPILTDAKENIEEGLGPIIEWLSETVLPAFEAALQGVRDWLQWVIDKVKLLIDWLKNLGNTDAGEYSPGSPSGFELGMRGIASAVAQTASVEIPSLIRSLSVLGASGGGGGDTYNHQEFNQVIHTSGDGVDAVIHGYRTLEAMAM